MKAPNILMCILVLYASACVSETPPPDALDGDLYTQAVAHPDRSRSDRNRDASRKPAEVFRFVELGSGMTVLELGAGGGYTTELVSRMVGADGIVYAQSFEGQSRLRKNRLPNIKAIEPHILWNLREKAEAAGLGAGEADVVLIFFALHDMYLNRRIDKDRLYRDIQYFLKPGGRFVVLDNAAEPGSGLRDANRTHRIDERFIKKQVTGAGFELLSESELLRNPDDDVSQSWQRTRPRGMHDRFALMFENVVSSPD